MNLLTTNSKKNLRTHQSEGGYILLMSLIILSVISIVATSLIDRQLMASGLTKNDQIDSIASKIKLSIEAAVYSNASWTETIGGNSCALSGNGCIPGQAAVALQLKDTSGNILADSTSANSGFDRWGNVCSAFDGVNGNDSCPFRYNLAWQPELNCPLGVCPIRVVGTLEFRPFTTKMGLINPNRYSINLIRGQEDGSIQAICQSLNGSFNQSTNKCELQTATPGGCGSGFYLMSSAESGSYKCLPLAKNANTCPTGSGAVGFNADGTLNCKSPGWLQL